MQKAPTQKEATLYWLWLGCISFGGPAGQIAMLREALVVKRKWISESRFMHALQYCMVLPGPEAQQLCIYLGWLLHGTRGGIIAGTLFVLPSMLLLALLSWTYVTFGQLPLVYAGMQGLKAAVMAIVLMAVIKLGKKFLPHVNYWLVAIIAFLAVAVGKVPFPFVVLVCGAIGWFAQDASITKNDNATISKEDESQYLINDHTPLNEAPLSEFALFKKLGIGMVLWTVPLLLLAIFAPQFSFWSSLCWFFTKAALVTFGGAYAVLPYVAQVSVEDYQWLTAPQMLDGLALGESTPGPLIIVLSFVGFMAGYTTFNASVVWGFVALLAATFYTFLPSFMFVLVGAPFIERSRTNVKVKPVLMYIGAAVVGMIVQLALFLGKAILWNSTTGLDIKALIWVGISLAALNFSKIPLWLWLMISVVFGMYAYA